jgi:hypothetical protein
MSPQIKIAMHIKKDVLQLVEDVLIFVLIVLHIEGLLSLVTALLVKMENVKETLT